MLVVDLRLLRSYVAVAEERHFARAAARLFITPPSLSAQIKSLEASLGVRLFDRDSRGVTLTPAGEALLGRARATLAEADALSAEAARLAAGSVRPLSFGFLVFSLTNVSRGILADYAREHPEVPLQVRQFEWDDPSAGLLSGAVEVAMVRPPFTGSDKLRTLELESDPLYAIMAADHPLAVAGHPVPVRRLVQEPFLEVELVKDPTFADAWYLRDHRDARSPKAVLSRAATSEEWLAEVAIGRGVDVVPQSVVRDYARPGLAFLPIADLAPSRLVLAWRRGKTTEQGRAFVAFCRTSQRRATT